MNKAKLMSLTLAAVVLSGVLVGVAYSTFHATYESTGNTISVGDVTAISVAQLNGSNLVEATNGSFACDLTVKSTTTARTTTYSFINTGRTTANLLDAYVYQSLDGAGAATGVVRAGAGKKAGRRGREGLANWLLMLDHKSTAQGWAHRPGTDRGPPNPMEGTVLFVEHPQAGSL